MNIKKSKASNLEATPILEDEKVLVFKVSRPVTDMEFELIKNRLEAQNDKEIKIILVPYSVELKEDN